MIKILHKPFFSVANFFSYTLLAISLLITPFVFNISVPDPALTPRLHFFNISVFILTLAWAIIYVWNRKEYDISVTRRNIYKFYMGYIIIAAFSVLFANNTSEGIYEWFKIFVFFVFFCLISLTLTRINNFPDVVAKFVIIFTILIAVRGFYEIISIASIKGLNHQNSYFIRAFSSHRNLYAQILFLALSFTLYGTFSLKKYWRITGIAASVMVLILITLLLTRSVWIAFVISMVVSFIILFSFWRNFSINRKTIKNLIIILITSIIIVGSGIFIYAKFGNVEVFRKQTYWIEDYKISSSLERVELWKKTISICKDHPITGVGLGGWNPCWTYLLLNDNVDPKALEAKFPSFIQSYFYDAEKDNITLYLQPLTDIHLKSKLDYEIEPNNSFTTIYMTLLKRTYSSSHILSEFGSFCFT